MSRATAGQIQLEVLSPAGQVLDEPVDEVIAPAQLGEMGVLVGHEPYVALLQPGTLVYRAGGVRLCLAVSGGFLEATPGRVLVLASTVERGADVDLERAKRALQARTAELARLGLDDPGRPNLERALARARARMAASDLDQRER